jgi:signal transduction histidine kinase
MMGEGAVVSESGVMPTGRPSEIVQRSWRPLDMVRSSLTWRAALYLAVSFGFGLSWFVVLVVGMALSAGLLIVWVGALLFVLLTLLWRGGAMLERRLLKAAFALDLPDPYRPREQGAGLFARWRSMMTDPATWKDLGYLLGLFPISVAEFMLSAILWSGTAVTLFLPIIILFTDTAVFNFGGPLFYEATNPLNALPMTVVGVGMLVLTMYATRMAAIGHALYARFLLGASTSQAEARQQRARADHLQASRARGVDAAEAERRRIERDLHDGAQQRLLAVAMDIGRARAKLADDPEAARALIEQAHSGTREAIAELRDLARGIYPAILTDRGLDSAISGLAGRAPVPVEVEVDLPSRPPAAVESIAYFIVAESLSNLAKYARATQASVRVTQEQHWVVVEISDNGIGGATATPGGGLAGLADRAATIDGILTVNSPQGGPTVIRADLPCTW